jgi:activating signal cointegrator complex subunit 2
VRKHNDIYKILTLEFTESQKQEAISSNNINYQIKESMSKLLDVVLRMYYRLSFSKESEENFLSLQFYNKVVYDNWIFDMPKLVDLAAIYGKSNSQIVASIISNVFENDKRYVVDFKEGIEMLINLIKKTFKEYHRIQTIIKGEYVKDMTNQEL